MNKLVLVRHGESKWNLGNKFTGQIDVSISSRGVQQCFDLGDKIKDIKFDYGFASCLSRSKETMSLILSKMKVSGVFIDEHFSLYSWPDIEKYPSALRDIPIFTNCLLNERHYGDLQGMDKNEARQKYGEEIVYSWRRGFDQRPPGGESLLDVYNRTIPYFEKRVVPLLVEGNNVMISAHGNSLRSIIKYIENIADDKIPLLEIYTGQMISYELVNGRFVSKKSKLSFNRPAHWEKIVNAQANISNQIGE
ncbi:MAG: histidine phosphatase family protein [Patescibacteria group bacterium]